jgi:hypothetical protein
VDPFLGRVCQVISHRARPRCSPGIRTTRVFHKVAHLPMRVPWHNTAVAMTGTWHYSIIRVDFFPDCARFGPIISCNNIIDYNRLRVDEVQLGPVYTTQARRLCVKIVQKAITSAHCVVFRRKPDLNQRISHVSLVKISPEL